MTSLRVALVAPLVTPIGDPFLGGSQALVFDLASGLASGGAAVTLFAADGSSVPGVEVVRLGIDPHLLAPTAFHRRAPDAALAERERTAFLRVAYEVRRRRQDFDVVHNHAFDAPPFELLAEAHPRVLHTLHLPPIVPAVVVAAAAARGAGATLVAVSSHAASSWEKRVGSIRTVVNGVPVALIPLGSRRRSGWLFVGRIAPEKGLEDAISAAEAAGKPLTVVGGVYDADYHARLRPRLARQRVFGALARREVFAAMGAAEGLLMPAAWDEPFGLAAAEAMAAGTPVAAYARGALPDLIDDGVTGYLVAPGDLEALRRAADGFGRIDPAACRSRALDRFDAPRMVREYADLYREAA